MPYAKQYLEAENTRELLIKKAAKALEPLGVKENVISSMVEDNLRKNAGIT